ncbi:MAG: hypothetical protein SPI12_01350 [Actinomycetaceae bacterium]|nr:hypothetical protein [Actinomycetaceae bacterium]MDY6082493.1 hypothetical protein [Actinomycetaceae bacterium]
MSTSFVEAAVDETSVDEKSVAGSTLPTRRTSSIGSNSAAESRAPVESKPSIESQSSTGKPVATVQGGSVVRRRHAVRVSNMEASGASQQPEGNRAPGVSEQKWQSTAQGSDSSPEADSAHAWRAGTREVVPVILAGASTLTEREVRRLAAIAGVDVVVVPSGHAGRAAVLTLTERSPMVVGVDFHPAYRGYFPLTTSVVHVKEEAQEMLELLLAAGSTRRGRIVGVIGAHGGAGSTTLACWLARTIAGDERCSLIDLDPLSTGVADAMGIAETPGLRWADVATQQGAFVPGRLLNALPQLEGLAVLTADDRASVPVSGDGAERAIAALAQVCEMTLLDLPRSALQPGNPAASWLEWCDLVIVVAVIGSVRSHRRAVEGLRGALPVVSVARSVHSRGQLAAYTQDVGVERVYPFHDVRHFDDDLAHGVHIGDRKRSACARDVRQLATVCMAAA